MKTKTTAKAIKEHYKKCYSAGYCELQFLLSRIEPLYYHAGVYGWDYDVYIIDDVAIFTGYRYPSRSGIKHIPYKIAEKYDKYAKKIIDANHSNKYELVSDVLKNLINDMITELN
jgi:hypothetical protein